MVWKHDRLRSVPLLRIRGPNKSQLSTQLSTISIFCSIGRINGGVQVFFSTTVTLEQKLLAVIEGFQVYGPAHMQTKTPCREVPVSADMCQAALTILPCPFTIPPRGSSNSYNHFMLQKQEIKASFSLEGQRRH